MDPTIEGQKGLCRPREDRLPGPLSLLNKRYPTTGPWRSPTPFSRSRADVETEQTGPYGYEADAWEQMYRPTNYDARHRLSVTGIVDLPWGFQLSGIFFYRSAWPWTAFYKGRT